jgi:predicted Zn-dependent protease with MMP-like domain
MAQRGSISDEEFEQWVQAAIKGLPRRYRLYLDMVLVVVEARADHTVLEELGLDSPDELLGLYTSISVADESFFGASGQLPAQIAIYRESILRLCHSKDEVMQEVRDTVVHELGHHFGLSDGEMPY